VATLLGVQVVAGAIAAVVAWRELRLIERLLRRESNALGPIFDAMAHSRLVARAGSTSFLVCASVWLLWQYRAHANLYAFTVPELEYRPRRAVIWWFVPVANLWRPFEALRELWKASGPQVRWWERTTWRLIGWWWVAWLFTGFGTPWLLVAFREIPDRRGIPLETITANRIVIAMHIASVVAGPLAIALVRSVDRRQIRLAAIRGADSPSIPPPPSETR
jgi:hypothetical protein